MKVRFKSIARMILALVLTSTIFVINSPTVLASDPYTVIFSSSSTVGNYHYYLEVSNSHYGPVAPEHGSKYHVNVKVWQYNLDWTGGRVARNWHVYAPYPTSSTCVVAWDSVTNSFISPCDTLENVWAKVKADIYASYLIGLAGIVMTLVYLSGYGWARV